MSFHILSASTRLARMVTWLAGIQTKITDFVVGGKTRTKLEAVAVEMEAQDLAFYQALKKAIPTACYLAFNHDILPATAATGQATFSCLSPAKTDVYIPIGTQIATVASGSEPERIYHTIERGTIVSGSTSTTVRIRAVVPGAGGNTGAGTIIAIKTTVSGVDSVVNSVGLSNGTDAETEEARRRRFTAFVTTLPRATHAGLIRGATEARLYDAGGNIVEQVVDALVGEPRPGLVYVYVFNGTGETSSALVSRAKLVIDGYTELDGTKVPGYKAAGIVSVVAAATEIPIDVTATLVVAPGFDATRVRATVEASFVAYLNSLRIGQGFIYHELVELAMAVPGVDDVVVSEPTENLSAQEVTSAVFSGTGLDDMTTGGSYTGAGRHHYVVEIQTEGTPDTFRWSNDDGVTWTDGVAITGATQELDCGVTVAFAATTGHTAADRWTFAGSKGVVFIAGAVTVS